ncbi:MAG TPA: class I SAM-dependent methyltransferase [Gallionella sp.]|nr:class I SAM-dependent methyltransferase [Gallionella sp.]
MAFKDHFSALSADYAAYRPGYPAVLFEYLSGLVAADARVWDCACGSGQASVPLSERFGEVYATDASAEQIAVAIPHSNVHYSVASAENSGLPDRSVDLVTVAQALHWFDLSRFYAEVRRVLKPGGIVAVWSYGVHHVDDTAIDAHMQDFYRNTIGPYWPPERRLVEEGYRTLDFPFAELQVPPMAMEATWTLLQLLGYLRSWSAVGRYEREKGQDPVAAFAAFAAEIAPLWHGETCRINWPLAVRVGRL